MNSPSWSKTNILRHSSTAWLMWKTYKWHCVRACARLLLRNESEQAYCLVDIFHSMRTPLSRYHIPPKNVRDSFCWEPLATLRSQSHTLIRDQSNFTQDNFGLGEHSKTKIGGPGSEQVAAGKNMVMVWNVRSVTRFQWVTLKTHVSLNNLFCGALVWGQYWKKHKMNKLNKWTVYCFTIGHATTTI